MPDSPAWMWMRLPLAATPAIAAGFLPQVLAQLPYQGHTVLTDNEGQFGNMPHHVHCGRHVFDQVYDVHGIEHCFIKPAHPRPTAV